MSVPTLPGLIVLAALGCLALGLISFAAAGVLCLCDAFRKARANVAAALSSVGTPSAPEALRDMAETLRYIDPTRFREAADCCEARALALERTEQPAAPVGMWCAVTRQIALGEPARIQRLRSKGWRAPAGAVYVGRGSQWGNPYAVRAHAGHHLVEELDTGASIFSSRDETDAHRVACDWYRAWLSSQPDLLAAVRRQLPGRDLMCWCPLPPAGAPDHCHGAVLLALANEAAR